MTLSLFRTQDWDARGRHVGHGTHSVPGVVQRDVDHLAAPAGDHPAGGGPDRPYLHPVQEADVEVGHQVRLVAVPQRLGGELPERRQDPALHGAVKGIENVGARCHLDDTGPKDLGPDPRREGLVEPDVNGAGIVQPLDITAGPDGALWFTGTTSLGRITTSGAITTFEHTGLTFLHGITTGPKGSVWFTDPGSGSIGRIEVTAITKFKPKSGVPGSNVSISGYNLAHATQVDFNGTVAAIVSDSATKIVATVPVGATTGPISVTTPDGTAVSSHKFTPK